MNARDAAQRLMEEVKRQPDKIDKPTVQKDGTVPSGMVSFDIETIGTMWSLKPEWFTSMQEAAQSMLALGRSISAISQESPSMQRDLVVIDDVTEVGQDALNYTISYDGDVGTRPLDPEHTLNRLRPSNFSDRAWEAMTAHEKITAICEDRRIKARQQQQAAPESRTSGSLKESPAARELRMRRQREMLLEHIDRGGITVPDDRETYLKSLRRREKPWWRSR